MAGAGTEGAVRPGAPLVTAAAVLLPLGAGFGYALGAVAVQRALGSGSDGRAVNLVCNGLMALLFQILWLFPSAAVPWEWLPAPIACGFLFFLGQICTFRAISAGDVSVATPLLGTKVLFVTLFSVALCGRALPASWWWASLMATAGIGLVSWSPGHAGGRILATVLWSLAAAVLFALTDVLVQQWVPRVGYARFAPLMFGAMGLFTLLHLPGGSPGKALSFPGKISMWLIAGGVLLSLQALAMYSSIGLFGSASMTNILYGSRCLWSILIVWAIAHAAREGSDSPAVKGLFLRRLAGAVMLLGAMALVLR